MIYLNYIVCFIFLIISGVWLWFKSSLYIYLLYKWYIVKRYCIKRSYIDLKEIIIHTAEIGKRRKDRSSLLLIHGAGGHLFNWIRMIQNLDRAKEHIIFMDLPGHGFSSVPLGNEITIDKCVTYIRECINKLGCENQSLHLIGQCMGGYLVAEYAVKYPKNIKLLTLIAPAGFGGVNNEFYEKMSKGDYSWLMPKTVEDIQINMNRAMVNPPKIPSQILSGILREMEIRYPFLEKMLFMWMNYNVGGIFKISSQIEQPTQIIWGSNDKILPVENVELLSAILPNCCDKLILDNCGHSIPCEKPKVLAKAIVDFRIKNGIL